MKKLLLAVLLFPAAASALTVEEAYRAVPHRQATYDPTLSTRSADETHFLAALFALSDRALVQRMETMQAFSRGDAAHYDSYERAIREILRELNELKPPPSGAGLTDELAA